MAELILCLVQPDTLWENPRANRERISRLLETVSGTDLIVLPEMFSTGFSMNSREQAEDMTGDTVRWMGEVARKRSSALCGSVIVSDGDDYFNRFIMVQPSGDIVTYDKRHLFRMSSENDNYSSGRARITFQSGSFRVFPQICYDLRFPVFSRNDLGFDLMVYVANWPAARREHWRTLLTARAIENQCYVVGVNRTGRDGNDIDYCGDSMVIDFAGRVMASLQEAEGTLVVSIDRDRLDTYRETFPAWKDADRFSLD